MRAQVRAELAQLPTAERMAASALARNRLQQQKVWKDASRVLFYAPLPDELDVWPLVEEALNAGKIIALPRFVETRDGYGACRICDVASDLCIGRFGIREPADHCDEIELKRLDLILVPGVAFDLLGRRLGRGKGFYDRLLGLTAGTTCGAGFDPQIVRELPVAPHDVLVNCILTPTRWIEP